MGRFLLLMCAGGLLIGTLAMGSTRRSVAAQDQRLSAHEAEVVARENALSALNQVLPFVADHFDALTSGQAVSVADLSPEALTLTNGSASDNVNCASIADRYNTDEACSGRYAWGSRARGVSLSVSTADVCRRYVGRRNVRIAPQRMAQLVGQRLTTLLPTREIASGSTNDAAVRARPGGKIEVLATGTYVVTNSNGTKEPRTFTIRRLYAKSSVLDAALIALAPSITPTLAGNYQIDGRDITSGSTPSGNEARYRPAVKTNSPLVAQRLGAVAGAANAPRFMGVNGSGDIVSGSVVADVEAIFDEAFVHPDRVLLASTAHDTTLGTATAPVVAVAPRNLNVQGDVRGTGILVVNGNLTTSGSGRLTWNGVVMVRKDGVWTGPDADLSVQLTNGSLVSGALVVSQGATAITVPFNSRLKVRYLGSGSAGLLSSVGIERSHNGELMREEIVPPGANRGSDVVEPYNVDLKAGDQLNFYIGVHYPAGYPDAALAGTEAYRNYARGHFDAAANMPYGLSEQTGPYGWKMRFEDLRQGVDIGYGSTPDWDFYDSEGSADQMIEVTLQCRHYDGHGSVVTSFGSPVYEDCTPSNPDTHVQEAPLNWAGLTASSGLVPSAAYGTNLSLHLGGAKVYHNSLAIARLVPLLRTIRERSNLVLLSSWMSF